MFSDLAMRLEHEPQEMLSLGASYDRRPCLPGQLALALSASHPLPFSDVATLSGGTCEEAYIFGNERHQGKREI